MFPEPCLHFRILTLELSRQLGLFICLSHLQICQFLKARPRSGLSLQPSTYRAAGTKRPARLLLPAAGALARASSGPFLSRQRLWLQPQRKAQALPQLTMGPLSQLVRALSGKTRPLPLHLSPKPAPRELQGSTQRRSPRSDSRVPRPPSRPGRAARFPGGWWVGGLPSHSC